MKGNLIIGQSGGPTAVINSSLAGVIKASWKAGIRRIYGMHYGIEGFLQEDILDLKQIVKNDEDISLLMRTPSAFLGSCRYKLPAIDGNEDVYEKIFSILEKNDIQYFLYNGGNDSMDTVKMLSDYAAAHGKTQKFMGIPKTIDNDLPVTDHCPGFGSAAKYIATSLKEIIADAECYGPYRKSVLIAEIMGRHAGWLTAAAALSDKVDLIYLPEVSFDPDDFVKRIKELSEKQSSIVVAVSEGIKLADGRFVCELEKADTKKDAFGHTQLSGVGKYLASLASEKAGVKARSIEFSTLQRCASHVVSETDSKEAFNVGYLAAKSAIEGSSGEMITIDVVSRAPYVANYSKFDIHQVANVERKVPMEWIINDGTYVSEDFIAYAKPLIMGELHAFYSEGVPVHLSL